MGADLDQKSRDDLRDKGQNGPLIAGSLLPSYYLDKQIPQIPDLSNLERLSALKEQGFLSEEEFILCKSKLLSHLEH